MPPIAQATVRSLLLRPYAGAVSLAAATGFVVEHGGRPFLVTNCHVVTGRNVITGDRLSSMAVLPERVEIRHNAAGQVGEHVLISEELYDSDGRGLWLEHPTHGGRVDVVALPLTHTDGAVLYPHDLHNVHSRVALNVTRDVSVVGFPFGRSSNNLAIWARGTIASEINLDHEGLPMYLIDSRTRIGQSGSPVVFFARGGIVPFEREDSDLVDNGLISDSLELFLGVYSGRISEESDIGMVWKPSALTELLAAGRRTDVRNGNALAEEPDGAE